MTACSCRASRGHGAPRGLEPVATPSPFSHPLPGRGGGRSVFFSGGGRDAGTRPDLLGNILASFCVVFLAIFLGDGGSVVAGWVCVSV